jgi:hypothetical protein
MTITLIALAVTSIALWLYYESNVKTEDEPKKVQSRYQKFKVPSQFWDDYNKINFYIHDMGIDECERVKYMIDDFSYKYAEIMEYKVFIDSLGNLITSYYSREKFLLQFKIK